MSVRATSRKARTPFGTLYGTNPSLGAAATLSENVRSRIQSLVLRREGDLDAIDSATPGDSQSAFLIALEIPRFFSDRDAKLSLAVGRQLEALVVNRTHDQGYFYEVCAALKDIYAQSGAPCSDGELSRRISRATGQSQAFSRGWISRNIRAGKFLVDHPRFKGLSPDRLCMLSQLPREQICKIDTDGTLGDVNMLTDGRETLMKKVREIRAGKDKNKDKAAALTRDESASQALADLELNLGRALRELPTDEPYVEVRKQIDALRQNVKSGRMRPVFSCRATDRKPDPKPDPKPDDDSGEGTPQAA